MGSSHDHYLMGSPEEGFGPQYTAGIEVQLSLYFPQNYQTDYLSDDIHLRMPDSFPKTRAKTLFF